MNMDENEGGGMRATGIERGFSKGDTRTSSLTASSFQISRNSRVEVRAMGISATSGLLKLRKRNETSRNLGRSNRKIFLTT
jgi:hypothetical protein